MVKKNRRVVLVRHGEAENNVLRINNSNPKIIFNLTETGVSQAKNTAERLKGFSFDLGFVSQITRAKETANIINEFHNLEMIEDERINDINTGLDGRTYDEYLNFFKESGFDINFKFNDEAESFPEMVRRIHDFLDDVVNRDWESLLIVSHGDPLKALEGYFRNLKLEEMFMLDMMKNCESKEIILEEK